MLSCVSAARQQGVERIFSVQNPMTIPIAEYGQNIKLQVHGFSSAGFGRARAFRPVSSKSETAGSWLLLTAAGKPL